jgi:hypothetical protein
MSTQQNTYVIFGVKLPFRGLTEKQREDLMDRFGDSAFKPARPFKELTALSDGMNGKYFLLGFVSARSDDQRSGAGIPLHAIPMKIDDALEAQMLEKLTAELPPKHVAAEPAWFVLTHYR